MLHVLHWSSAIYCNTWSLPVCFLSFHVQKETSANTVPMKQDIHRSSANMFHFLSYWISASMLQILPLELCQYDTFSSLELCQYAACSSLELCHMQHALHGSSASLLLVLPCTETSANKVWNKISTKALPKQYETRYPQKLCQYVSFSHWIFAGM